MLEGYTEAEQMDLRRERDDKKKRGRFLFFFYPLLTVKESTQLCVPFVVSVRCCARREFGT